MTQPIKPLTEEEFKKKLQERYSPRYLADIGEFRLSHARLQGTTVSEETPFDSLPSLIFWSVLL